MTDFRRVSDHLSVSPQISPAEVAQARAQGFTTLVNNRPDGEAPGQPTSAQIEQAARQAGLAYVHIPVTSGPTPQQVERTRAVIEGSDGPVLAFCRTGTRCIITWALGERQAGRDRGELLKMGADAGYDLSGALRE